MNNDIMLQSLTEAFEILKDSWTEKSISITNCIVETEQYDGSLAMDMWQYIVQNNSDDINCFYSVLRRFGNKYSRWTTKENYCKVYLEHVVKYIKNDNFISTIFGKVIGAGACIIADDGSVSFLPAFIASILLIDNSSLAMTMIKSMARNDKLLNNSIGKILASTQEYVEAVRNHISEFDIEYEVTDSVKEAMYNSIATIQDKEIRAECTIAILSF